MRTLAFDCTYLIMRESAGWGMECTRQQPKLSDGDDHLCLVGKKERRIKRKEEGKGRHWH